MHEPQTLTLDRNEVTLFRALDTQTRPCLILYSGQEPGRRFDLTEGRYVLGRSEQADLRIDASGISRAHAEVEVGATGTVLRDLGSANHSYVNDQLVAAPVLLRDGDLVRLANQLLRFHDRRSVDAALHERLYRLATTDPGTAVFNRRQIEQALTREFATARRRQQPLSLICCDLDRFKQVNDTHGHLAGDQVLRRCAELLRGALRERDLVGRWGGEEFVVIAPATPMAEALVLAERLRAVVAGHAFELRPLADRPPLLHHQTLSLGVAELTPGMADEHALVAEADARLYAAKRAGRNRVQGARD